MVKVLAFSGSSRKGSSNLMAVNAVVAGIENVTHLDLGDLSLPIYNGDEEAQGGLPEGAAEFRRQLSEHDAFVIGCPEYNGFMTPLLINAIDWATRSPEAAPDLSCFHGKVVLIVSASPGGLGGMRAATHLRTMLSGIGAMVLPDSFTVPGAMKAFDEQGQLVDEQARQRASQVGDRLVQVCGALQQQDT